MKLITLLFLITATITASLPTTPILPSNLSVSPRSDYPICTYHAQVRQFCEKDGNKKWHTRTTVNIPYFHDEHGKTIPNLSGAIGRDVIIDHGKKEYIHGLSRLDFEFWWTGTLRFMYDNLWYDEDTPWDESHTFRGCRRGKWTLDELPCGKGVKDPEHAFRTHDMDCKILCLKD